MVQLIWTKMKKVNTKGKKVNRTKKVICMRCKAKGVVPVESNLRATKTRSTYTCCVRRVDGGICGGVYKLDR